MEMQMKNFGIDVAEVIAGEFNRFGNHFTEKELSFLRGLDGQQMTDAVFLRSILEFLYKDNVAGLAKKTAKGRCADSTPISPEKIEVIKAIFEERIDSLDCDLNEATKRKESLNQLLSKCLYTVRKKSAKKLFLPN